MHDVTHILSQIDSGVPGAAEQLLPLVYEELRKLAGAHLAQEKPGQTLQATGLVHEAYVRLVKFEGDREWNGRGHFFGAAAEAMRRILLDRARAKRRLKRGGDRKRIDLDSIQEALVTPAEDLLALDDVLGQFADAYPQCAQVVKLRFFAGLTQGEAAEALQISRRTADRYWAFARAWLRKRLDVACEADLD